MDDLCEITSSKRIFAADYVSEGVPFYRGRAITEKYKGNLNVSTELFITDNKFREIERKFGAPKQGDLLLTSVGTLGSVYVVKHSDRFYFKDGNLTWFRHFKGLDSQFLYYWIGSPQGKAELQKCTIGSSQSALTIVLLKSMEIELPPLPIQQRIASILSAYDDLIENNQRRIKILESMARALYREWFVHFRFPGHENHPRVASPVGEIPEGWEVKKLGDLITYSRRTTKPGPNLEERRYVPIDCLPPRSLALLEAKPLEEAQSSLQLFETGDILFGAMRPYFHKVVVAPFSGVTRTTCFVFKPAHPQWHAFATMTAFDEATVAYANANSQGATIPYAVWDGSLSEMPLVMPPTEVLHRFEAVVAPMLLRLAQSFFALGNLRRTRDLLLPRLLSGQIEIEDI
jgi:type I restriction enzyme S subunit